MRIAYVYDAVHPWETGGVQKRVWELARRLADDHDVHWFGLHYWDGPAVVEREGVILHGVGPPTDLYVDGRRSIPEALSYAARLVGPLNRASFDVIDCQEFPYFPSFVSRAGATLRGATMVMTWHEIWGDYWYDYLGWKGIVGKAIERLTAATPHAHLAVSERTRDDLRSLGVTNAHRSPNGISMDEIRGAPVADRDVDVLFAGRMIPEKNPTLLIDAFDELVERDPDVTCLLVGEGPEAAAVDQAIDDLDIGGNVAREPFRDAYEDVLGLMKAADVFALPSRREGFGITALEALATGTPVVTIDHDRNAITELVTDGETGSIRTERASAIADGIEAAREIDPAECVRSAERYEWDRVAAHVERIYREVA